MDNLSDTLSGECLLPETPLDVVQHLSVRGIGLVKDVLEGQISRTETVTEMLSKDPTAVLPTKSHQLVQTEQGS